MENNDNTQQYIDALQEVYVPATSAGDTTHWFSTQDVFNAIKDVDPAAEVSKEQLHAALLNNGYRYRPREGTVGLQFHWMMKLKI